MEDKIVPALGHLHPALGYLPETPSQTAGPYLHIGTVPDHAGIGGVFPEDLGRRVCGPKAEGASIRIEGHVFDGTGTALKDALVEIWQADSAGRHASPLDPRGPSQDPHFFGFGRCACDGETGLYGFDTVKPGRVPSPTGAPMAPHVTLFIVARGINMGLHTRLYFPDEDAANAEDPVLARIEQTVRRSTLIARRDGGEGRPVYRFDICLQDSMAGSETVFFDI
ncbi:MAG: protocatechuate 3,4-dioxygenase subunit alpha [Inquilinaceae bacterium]